MAPGTVVKVRQVCFSCVCVSYFLMLEGVCCVRREEKSREEMEDVA